MTITIAPIARCAPVRFTFEDGPVWLGFSAGSFWNGFHNVMVEPATRDAIAAWLEAEEPGSEPAAQMRALGPVRDERGRIVIDLSNGWTTHVLPSTLYETVAPANAATDPDSAGIVPVTEYRVMGCYGFVPGSDPYDSGFTVEVLGSNPQTGETVETFHVMGCGIDEFLGPDWDACLDFCAASMRDLGMDWHREPPQWLREFNGFDHGDACAKLIAYGFTDQSWHNDACPSFYMGGWRVFVDWRDPAQSDFPESRAAGGPVFSVNECDDDGSMPEDGESVGFDDLDALIAYCEASWPNGRPGGVGTIDREPATACTVRGGHEMAGNVCRYCGAEGVR